MMTPNEIISSQIRDNLAENMTFTNYGGRSGKKIDMLLEVHKNMQIKPMSLLSSAPVSMFSGKRNKSINTTNIGQFQNGSIMVSSGIMKTNLKGGRLFNSGK
jgi:hypothetical protein